MKLQNNQGPKYDLGLIIYSWAGAGHARQAVYLAESLKGAVKLCGKIKLICVDIEAKEAGLVSKLVGRGYAWLQTKPLLYERVGRFLSCPGFRKLVDRQVMAIGQPEQLRKAMLHAGWRPGVRTLWMMTHVSGAASLVRLSESGRYGYELVGDLVEFSPDPWKPDLALWSTTCPKPFLKGKHVVVLHDRETALRYKRYRSGGRVIRPWGTLSEPAFWNRPGWQLGDPQAQIELVFEWGGNANGKYTDKITQFVETIKESVERREVRLVFVVMHHASTKRRIEKKLRELGLVARIVWNKNKDVAVRQRARVIRSQVAGGANRVYVTKGGEVPLEYREGALIWAIYGAGHEGEDIRRGVKLGWTVDARKLPVAIWLGEMRKMMAMRRKLGVRRWKQMVEKNRSRAHLAPLTI